VRATAPHKLFRQRLFPQAQVSQKLLYLLFFRLWSHGGYRRTLRREESPDPEFMHESSPAMSRVDQQGRAAPVRHKYA
jgi:hypothetical protein